MITQMKVFTDKRYVSEYYLVSNLVEQVNQFMSENMVINTESSIVAIGNQIITTVTVTYKVYAI